MTSHSDSEPDDDTITIAQNKVVISRVCGIGGASRTKQNNKQNQQPMTIANHDQSISEVIALRSTVAEFGD